MGTARDGWQPWKQSPYIADQIHFGPDDNITLQLKKLGNLDRYLDIFQLIGVFIRRGPEPNSAAVGTT